MTPRRAAILFAALAAAAGASGAACSSKSASVAGAGNDLNLGSGSGGFDPNSACGAYDLVAADKPVNLYVMFDKSSSMAGPKWDAAKTGLGAFVVSEASKGINVGLRFFPRPPDATPACDQKAYEKPLVPFGPLPGNAAAIQQAIAAEKPDGFGTPMYPALGGALLEGIALAQSIPGSVSAVLLVTDGVPEGPAASCSGVNPSDPAEVAKLAAAGAAFHPPVLTYVVGLPGVDQASANLIAKSGGTGSAILVAASDVAGEFEKALSKVRADVLPCSYALPDKVVKGQIALTLVNIQITHDGKKGTVPYDPACAGNAWKYDNLDKPTAIELCPTTCTDLKADKKAAIQVILGCDTVVP